jgi:hypothetical protein
MQILQFFILTAIFIQSVIILPAQQLITQAKAVSVLVNNDQIIGYSWGIAIPSKYEPTKQLISCKFTKVEKAKASNVLLVKTCLNKTINIYFTSEDSFVCKTPCSFEGTTFNWNDEVRWAPDGTNYRVVNSEILVVFGSFTDPSGTMIPAAANISFRTWPTNYQDYNFPILMGGTFGVELGQK